MHGIFVTLLGNKEGVYIDPKNGNAHVDGTKAVNYTPELEENANHFVIARNRKGEMRIVQVGGYTAQEGLFCRVL